MKVWEYLDFFARCYGLAAGRAAADDRRPARAGRPRRQARRLRPGPVARHAAAAVPRPRARPRPAGAAARRAGVRASTRAPGSSCASCCASCARWARRSSSAATSSPSSRSCAPPSRSSTAARCSPRAGSPTSSDGCASARCSASGCCSRARRSTPRAPGSRPIPTSPRPSLLEDGTIEIGFRGDDEATARLLAASIAAGLPIAELRPRGERPRGAVPPGHRRRTANPWPRHEAPAMTELTATTTPVPPPSPRWSSFARTVGGITAIGVKELRGRMRGRRAFVILTIYLAAARPASRWMVERIIGGGLRRAADRRRRHRRVRPSARAIFAALLMLMTLHRVPRPGVDRRRDQRSSARSRPSTCWSRRRSRRWRSSSASCSRRWSRSSC